MALLCLIVSQLMAQCRGVKQSISLTQTFYFTAGPVILKGRSVYALFRLRFTRVQVYSKILGHSCIIIGPHFSCTCFNLPKWAEFGVCYYSNC